MQPGAACDWEGKAVVLWKTVERKKTKPQTGEADGKVDLEKGADGLWRVRRAPPPESRCWTACRRRGDSLRMR